MCVKNIKKISYIFFFFFFNQQRVDIVAWTIMASCQLFLCDIYAVIMFQLSPIIVITVFIYFVHLPCSSIYYMSFFIICLRNFQTDAYGCSEFLNVYSDYTCTCLISHSSIIVKRLHITKLNNRIKRENWIHVVLL